MAGSDSPAGREEETVAVIGAGPAGLTAAYVLAKAGVPVRVFESDPERVGGIARTVVYKGFRFDIGGHRFFSRSKDVEELWTELLPHDMLDRRRSSRIFYGGKLFSYPLQAGEALFKLGVLQSALCFASYLKASLLPVRPPRNLEEWVSNQFGRRLYDIFFKTYTEKVWGMRCTEISADWAAQRIKGLSLASAILHALLPARRSRDRSKVIRTLVESFRYPRKGPGMLWEACASRVNAMGSEVLLGQTVVHCAYDAGTQAWTLTHANAAGQRHTTRARHLISSAPMRELAQTLEPALSSEALAAAMRLRYRDFLTVVLILNGKELFQDNWIYIHDPSVLMGRIQNFKSWSPEMVPDPSMSCYGLEYFCFEGDALWSRRDDDLLALGRRELQAMGLAAASDVVDGCVVRQRKAYPVYDQGHAANVEVIRRELERRFPTLHLVGRNGMHKYDNQDHAMMTAMFCARNILAGRRCYDPWNVNQDGEYHKLGERGSGSEISGASRGAP
jgi:protoporphyrinogen oxidase